MVSVGSKKASVFSIDSLLGTDANKVRSPSPVGSVSSCSSSDNGQIANGRGDPKNKQYRCHEEIVEGCRTCYDKEINKGINENGMIISEFNRNRSFVSQKHLPFYHRMDNGLLGGLPSFPPHAFHVQSSHSNSMHDAVSWLHHRQDAGHPFHWSARLGGQIHSRYSVHETPLLLPHFRKPKRIRTAFSPSQLLRLEHAFEKNHYVVGQERKDLASGLGLSETQNSYYVAVVACEAGDALPFGTADVSVGTGNLSSEADDARWSFMKVHEFLYLRPDLLNIYYRPFLDVKLQSNPCSNIGSMAKCVESKIVSGVGCNIM